MTENPAPFVFTVGINSFFTVVAFTTGTDTRNQDLVAFFEIRNSFPNFFNNPNPFVTKNGTTLASGNIPFDNMEVCSTNSSFYDTHNSVCWLAKHWFVYINKRSKSWFNISIGFHKALLRFFICTIYTIIVSLFICLFKYFCDFFNFFIYR